MSASYDVQGTLDTCLYIHGNGNVLGEHKTEKAFLHELWEVREMYVLIVCVSCLTKFIFILKGNINGQKIIPKLPVTCQYRKVVFSLGLEFS